MDPAQIIQAIERSEIWSVARETFYEIPFWLRAGLFVFVVTSAIVSKWILPAWANLRRARVEK